MPSFTTALSGLRASSDSLGVTGNNIANANTTAFKRSSISFADVFNSIGARINGAGSSVQIGNGVQTVATPTNFTQGTFNDTGAPTNAAIQGNGFFVVESSLGGRSYTRAGDFTLDRNGFLVTPGGDKVQGYAAVDGSIQPGSPLTSIKIPVGETFAPKVTTEATLRMNLNSTDASGSAFHAPVQVFDSKGVSHTLDIVFTKQTDGTYLIEANLDGTTATVTAGAVSPAALTFDSNGVLTSPALLSIEPDQTALDGATLPNIDINLFQTNPDGSTGPANITNYAAASTVASTQQDGAAAGSLTGLSITADGNGTINAVFSNGQTRPLGQLAIATFNSQSGLNHLGGNLFGETPASGQPSFGAAGTGGRGEIVGGSLEQSNVDLASEFTDLIVAQRSFQANSRVITTINQTLQDLIQSIS